MEEIKEMEMVEVVDIQFRPGQKVYFSPPAICGCRQVTM